MFCLNQNIAIKALYNYDVTNSDETPILEDDENNKYVNIINDIKSDPKLSVVGKKVFDYVINSLISLNLKNY